MSKLGVLDRTQIQVVYYDANGFPYVVTVKGLKLPKVGRDKVTDDKTYTVSVDKKTLTGPVAAASAALEDYSVAITGELLNYTAKDSYQANKKFKGDSGDGIFNIRLAENDIVNNGLTANIQFSKITKIKAGETIDVSVRLDGKATADATHVVDLGSTVYGVDAYGEFIVKKDQEFKTKDTDPPDLGFSFVMPERNVYVTATHTSKGAEKFNIDFKNVNVESNGVTARISKIIGTSFTTDAVLPIKASSGDKVQVTVTLTGTPKQTEGYHFIGFEGTGLNGVEFMDGNGKKVVGSTLIEAKGAIPATLSYSFIMPANNISGLRVTNEYSSSRTVEIGLKPTTASFNGLTAKLLYPEEKIKGIPGFRVGSDGKGEIRVTVTGKATNTGVWCVAFTEPDYNFSVKAEKDKDINVSQVLEYVLPARNTDFGFDPTAISFVNTEETNIEYNKITYPKITDVSIDGWRWISPDAKLEKDTTVDYIDIDFLDANAKPMTSITNKFRKDNIKVEVEEGKDVVSKVEEVTDGKLRAFITKPEGDWKGSEITGTLNIIDIGDYHTSPSSLKFTISKGIEVEFVSATPDNGDTTKAVTLKFSQAITGLDKDNFSIGATGDTGGATVTDLNPVTGKSRRIYAWY